MLACAALPLPDGGTLLTYNDVSDAKRMERALIERNEALEEADRLKSTFISHVSYELRTPLNSILGFAQLLASPAFGPLADKQREYVNDILASGITLRAIIDDILDLTTIDAGTLELNLSPVSVREVIDAAANGVRERLKQNDMTLDVSIEPGIDQFVADGARVTQILYNLALQRDRLLALGRQDRAQLPPREFNGRLHASRIRGSASPRSIRRPCSNASRAARTARAIAAPGLGCPSSRASPSCMGAPSISPRSRGKGTRVKVLLPLTHEPKPHDQKGEAPISTSRATGQASQDEHQLDS